MPRLPHLPALLALSALSVGAQIVVDTAPGVAIPDGGGFTGVQSTVTVSTSLRSITDVDVRLVIQPVSGDAALNGDLYAYLSHAGRIAVLVNRIGRTSGNPDGSLDNGLDVLLDDEASVDIHVHTPVTQPDPPAVQLALTGTWRPDGRNVLPTTVTDATPRTALLSAFDGTDPNGEWTLFVSDFGSGAAARLTSWQLTVAAVVPEAPAWAWAWAGGAAALWIGLGRRRGR